MKTNERNTNRVNTCIHKRKTGNLPFVLFLLQNLADLWLNLLTLAKTLNEVVTIFKGIEKTHNFFMSNMLPNYLAAVAQFILYSKLYQGLLSFIRFIFGL